MATTATSSALAVTASTLAVEAAAAQEAAVVATATAEMAAAAAASSAEIAAATAGTGSALAAGAAEAAAAAALESEAFAATAVAAAASAAEITAAAEEAAAAVAAAGETASVGWAGMLGPIGAVVVGVGILALVMGRSRGDAQEAAKAQNTYADSVRQSTVATSAANQAQTLKNLADGHALTALADLHAQNLLLGVSQQDLTTYITGTKQQAIGIANAMDGSMGPATAAQSEKIYRLGYQLRTLRNGLSDAIKAQLLFAQAQHDQQVALDGGNSAVARQARLLGTNSDAYLTAEAAAQKNTTSTEAQTLAFQLENDAAGLVNQALQTMAGQNLSNSQAQTALDQATLTLTASLRTNGSTVADNTTKGVANRQAIEGAASALRGKYSAEAAATGSTVKATTQYRANAVALLAQIGRLDGTNSAAYRYAQQLLKIPPVKKTRIDLDAAQAKRDLANFLASFPNVKTITVTTAYKSALGPGSSTYASQVPQGHAGGGTVGGTGTGKSDSNLIAASIGEEVIANPYAGQYRSLLKSINAGQGPMLGLPGYAAGGTVTSLATVGASSGAAGGDVVVHSHLYLDGAQVQQSLLRLKRQRGGGLGLN
jgi:hypothetical protein